MSCACILNLYNVYYRIIQVVYTVRLPACLWWHYERMKLILKLDHVVLFTRAWPNTSSYGLIYLDSKQTALPSTLLTLIPQCDKVNMICKYKFQKILLFIFPTNHPICSWYSLLVVYVTTICFSCRPCSLVPLVISCRWNLWNILWLMEGRKDPFIDLLEFVVGY